MQSVFRNSGSNSVNYELSNSNFQIIQQFLSMQCGIVLNENKHYLVKNRLIALLDKFGLDSFTDLTNTLESNSAQSGTLRNAVIDAMTTNETSWFRDVKHFSVLKETIFPTLLTENSQPLKIWSAACSSGQEPYSISITALQNTPKPCSVQILGTDISETMLYEAKQAIYSELALSRGIDAATQARFFQNTTKGYSLNNEVTQQVSFQQLNLLKPFSSLGLFDIIFCRNVLIYFSDTVKFDILNRMSQNLKPGGYFFLSSTESMPIGLDVFERQHGSLVNYYKKTRS
ncbi:protein-glutamate O-methyltransferase CheR [Methylomonas sp. AM2-LC]|uniref:CheR family methyltransferase n=1 Tax=Methylomonas sp. AM2-LC TaxID=3153301 RepID=UPI003264E9AA